jgi:hypothetical protein
MDFTLIEYQHLLNALITEKYNFQTYSDYIKTPKERVIILRHDVDLLPYNSLDFAKIQAKLNIQGTYYFRAVPESWDENVIKTIHSLGHEIGYHYESLTTCKGNMDKAFEDFKSNLDKLRQIAPVSTICMHGSPMSKYDSKQLWENYSYRELEIIGEPYFDIDFNEFLYLTDTGMKWNGEKTSIRDFVNSSFQYNFRSTSDIIKAINSNSLPTKIMFTFHPQRWNDSMYAWTKEFVVQSLKNQVKKVLKIIKK